MKETQSRTVAAGKPKLELLRALTGRFKHEFIAVAIFSAVANVLMLSPTLYMLQVFDRVLISRSELTLLVLTVLVLGFYALQAACEWMRSRLMIATGLKIDLFLSMPVFRAMFRDQLAGSGIHPGRAFADMTIIRQWMTGQGAFAYFDLPWSPVYLVVMFMLHPLLGWMALVFMLVLAAFAWWTSLHSQGSSEVAELEESKLDSYVQSKLRNAEIIEAHGMAPNLMLRWWRKQVHTMRVESDSHAHEESFTVSSKELRVLMQSLAIGGSALLAIEGEISFGTMIAASLLIGRATSPIDQVVAGWNQFVSARSALARLQSLLSNDIAEGKYHLNEEKSLGVKLSNVVAFAKNRERPILAGINASFPGGRVYAVIGESGAGKSTLGKTILGIWPELKGEVIVEGIDLKDLDQASRARNFGYLPQEIELFSATVAQNIARMSDPDTDLVINAAKLTGTHEMILRLPKGYDTQIGEAGAALSGGQRQRIGLARAVYGSPRLVVLDEPNANLDDAGDLALVEVIKYLKSHNTTVFLITHRQNILRFSDDVIYMANGKISKIEPASLLIQKPIAGVGYQNIEEK
jgi:ATP-binding cassette subfamily C exporter for protease/lipase